VSEVYWSVPRIWEGQSCAIMAGGPSMTQEAADAVRAAGIRSIAINNSYLLAPWADILYFCDKRWWEWHHKRQEFKEFAGVMVTLDNVELSSCAPQIKRLKNVGRLGLSLKPGEVFNGSNSGYQAINLAVQLGARRILLLGYDMGSRGKKTHWHGGHPVSTPESVYRSLMIPAYSGMKKRTLDLGVEVINATPGSALQEFPIMELNKALKVDRERASMPSDDGGRDGAGTDHGAAAAALPA
jgi:hypothetical protein